MPATKLKPTPLIKSKVGRPRIEIDLERVEELASLGLSRTRIAEGLGISYPTLKDRSEEVGNLEFSLAIKRGHFKWSEKLARRIDALTAKNNAMATIPLIFSAKQPHGLGWVDQRTVETTGDIKVTVTHQVLEPVKQGVIDQAKVIDHVDDE